jgi:hypothetical protein
MRPLFRRKAATQSDRKRTPIPANGHPAPTVRQRHDLPALGDRTARAGDVRKRIAPLAGGARESLYAAALI